MRDEILPAHKLRAPYEIHSVVALNRRLDTPDGSLPIGSRGTVHNAKPDGSLYLVEFDNPLFCVVEVPGKALRAA